MGSNYKHVDPKGELDEMRQRLMHLHQKKIEPELIGDDPMISLTLNYQELRDLSEFMSIFLYD